jgi:hypothetical protein
MSQRQETPPEQQELDPDPHLGGGYASLQHRNLEGVTKVDWLLFVLTIYPSVFLLQFSNNPLMRVIQRPGPRRALMLGLLAVEVAVVLLIVWFVAWS